METGQEYLLICSCSAREHQLIIAYDKEDNEAYVSVHLQKLNFITRLKYAFQYLLGKKSRYGAFDEFILRYEDADKLIEIGKKLKNIKDK